MLERQLNKRVAQIADPYLTEKDLIDIYDCEDWKVKANNRFQRIGLVASTLFLGVHQQGPDAYFDQFHCGDPEALVIRNRLEGEAPVDMETELFKYIDPETKEMGPLKYGVPRTMKPYVDREKMKLMEARQKHQAEMKARAEERGDTGDEHEPSPPRKKLSVGRQRQIKKRQEALKKKEKTKRKKKKKKKNSCHTRWMRSCCKPVLGCRHCRHNLTKLDGITFVH
jgi:hypothetical protein